MKENKKSSINAIKSIALLEDFLFFLSVSDIPLINHISIKEVNVTNVLN